MEKSNKIDNADLVKLFMNIIKDMEEKQKQEIADLTGKLEMELCLNQEQQKAVEE